MTRFLMTCTASVALALPNVGCMSRLIKEGAATVTGASGKVVEVQKVRNLSKYKGLRIESLTASSGLKLPEDMTMLVREAFIEAAAKKGLKPSATPALKLVGEIIHYESGGLVDEAVGPLEEVIVRTKLMDDTSGEVLTEANLIGRSKATTSSGKKHLAEGCGKAISTWLKECGLKGDEADKD
ncbi:MAG TPA: hypothetical protein VLM89_01225 [Phycisphaerae bacterium]|nr:hypothetical protein [Phycisphaerae bacterium]